ncbi:MAG: glycosyl transferase family 2 [Clostridiales bacterium]|nr:glycosyl transferase family 2 [Clostridiales bacterium]
MERKITDLLNGRGENYILPFFWQHGEDDETLIREIDAIYNSSIRAVCVESRTHEQFCRDEWWHTMDVILDACAKRGMKVWLLDDKHFPSGYANGIIPEKYPDQTMWGMTERHMDVYGPQKDGAVEYFTRTSPNDELLAVVACKRSGVGEELTGEAIDLTDCLEDDMVYFDVPEGCWRVYFIFKTQSGIGAHFLRYADKLTEFGGDAYIEAVYQPHFERYGSYFGTTFAGFFSDEPCFSNGLAVGKRPDLGVKYSHFPYAPEVIEKLSERFGETYRSMLPFIWGDADAPVMRTIRLAYMDIITDMYKRYFSGKLGDWCRAHGCEYIGHIVEDDEQHTGTGHSAGHFFRSLDGQDMAGIDVVLCQTVPGMTDNIITVPCSYDIVNPDFYHFTLPKLGSSHAHIQPEKKGRAMCEIFGAYGWAEGLKMMKWLTDLMLVRGINHYVPHAFTPKFPDPDCPPHMFAQGTNPQYVLFRRLAEYMNRVCHITNGGRHIQSTALLYHAEARWASKCENYMKVDVPARYLTEHGLDYDIVSADYLNGAKVENGQLMLADESYPCLVIPQAEYLPEKLLRDIASLANDGLPVICIGQVPEAAEGGTYSLGDIDNVKTVKLETLDSAVRKYSKDITVSGEYPRFLRFYHYVSGDTHYYMFTNEGIRDTIECSVRFPVFKFGHYVVYDAMENIAWRETDLDGSIRISLKPYESLIYVFGDTEGIPLGAKPVERCNFKSEITELSGTWEISTAEPAAYPVFTPYRSSDTLFNITGRGMLPRFSGHIKYELTFNNAYSAKKSAVIDLGYVGECAELYVNGQPAGTRIAPPYRFNVSSLLCKGENRLTVEVTNHYGWKMRDRLSQYLLFEPSGLLGPVTLEIEK